MDSNEALKAWGASKLPNESWDYKTRGNIKVTQIFVDTVSVEFQYEQAYSCCNGTDPDCYCSFATDGYARVMITGDALLESGEITTLCTYLEAEELQFFRIINEMVDIAGTITNSKE